VVTVHNERREFLASGGGSPVDARLRNDGKTAWGSPKLARGGKIDVFTTATKSGLSYDNNGARVIVNTLRLREKIKGEEFKSKGRGIVLGGKKGQVLLRGGKGRQIAPLTSKSRTVLRRTEEHAAKKTV